jgi:hypothetical protein
MSLILRRQIPILIVFVVALIVMLDYFLLLPPINPETSKSWTSVTVTTMQNWGVILSAFALGFGALNLFIFHSRHIARRTAGQWPFSLWMLAMIVLFTVVGVSLGPTSDQYSWLYNSSYFALSATVYSSLGFYMTSGIYRALRARNVESAILLIVGVIVLAMNAPALAVAFPILSDAGSWISAIPTTSAQRGIMIGASLGAIALGVRTMIGRETGFLGRLTEAEKVGGGS